jgi:cytidine deaminase
MDDTMTDEELLEAARVVREKAYCPYSGFHVGAALLDDTGQVHVSCCAEAGAISAMIAAGGKRIVTIAVAGGDEDKTRACTPCGGCRQRIHEFADEQTRIIVKDDDDVWHTYSMDDLLPSSFHL